MEHQSAPIVSFHSIAFITKNILELYTVVGCPFLTVLTHVFIVILLSYILMCEIMHKKYNDNKFYAVACPL